MVTAAHSGMGSGAYPVIAAVIGVSAAVAVVISGIAGTRKRREQIAPDLAQRWSCLSRTTRRSIRQAIWKRAPVAAEHAALVVATADAAVELGRTTITTRRGVLKTGGGFVANVALAGLFTLRGDEVERAIGVAVGIFGLTLGVAISIAVIQRTYWKRQWLPRLLDARASADEVLRPTSPST